MEQNVLSMDKKTYLHSCLLLSIKVGTKA